MKKSTGTSRVFLMLGCALAAACSSTQVVSNWKDPAYQTQPQKIMVIALAKSPSARRSLEDAFVNRLESRGMDAVAGYTFFPDQGQATREAIAEKLKEQNVDAVVISRAGKKEDVYTYVPGTVYPPYYGAWGEYYGYGFSAMADPGYLEETTYVFVETNMYSTANDKLVWSARSKTALESSNQQDIQSYVNAMVKDMADQKLIK